MLPSRAAEVFQSWAHAEGLMPGMTGVTALAPPDEVAKITNLTPAGKQLLRSRQIQSVGFNSSNSTIVVFSRKAAPTTKKHLAALPKQVDDVLIEYRQGLQNIIGVGVPEAFGGPAFTVRTVNGNEYYACGSSISVGNNRDAGTLSCLVRDASGNLFGLSNNHVTGSCSHAGVGLPILAPGVFDVMPGGLPPFTIGFHHIALPMLAGSVDNVSALGNSDAALFKIKNPAEVTSFQGATYDTPSTSGPLGVGTNVEKVGRTTGHTKGKVISQIFGPYSIPYSAPLYGFSGTVYFDPVFAIAGDTEQFSDFGDSGSLIVEVDANGNRTAVGIVIGGMNDGSAPGGKITIALGIETILARLSVTLVSGHNV